MHLVTYKGFKNQMYLKAFVNFFSWLWFDHTNSGWDRWQVHRTQLESVLLSVSVQCEQLHTVLLNPYFMCLSFGLGHYQCDDTITPLPSNKITLCFDVAFLIFNCSAISQPNPGATAWPQHRSLPDFPTQQQSYVPPHPDDEDDGNEENQTYKVSFRSMSKSRALLENFYCGGVKKTHTKFTSRTSAKGEN